MRVKLQIPDLIILMTIASTLLYLVAKNLPFGIGSFRFMWGPLALITILFCRPIAFTKGPMRFLLLYGALSVGILQYTLWNYMDDWNRSGILEDFYILTVFVAIWNYYWIICDFKRLAILCKWAFLFIVITLIMTNIALTIDPLIVRNAATGFVDDPFQMKLSKLTGSASYGYAQAIVLLIPILVYHIKNRKQMVFPHKALIAILILILITTIRVQVFANLLVASLITLLAIMGSKNRYLGYRFLAIFVIIYVIIPTSFYAYIFTNLGSYFKQDTEIHYKLNDFALFIQNPELTTTTEAGGRSERYPQLFEALVSNPLFGHASYKSHLDIGVGGHLYWMNKLALWGILGFLFFVFVLYKIYKTIIYFFIDTEIWYNYFLSVLALILFGLTKNIAGREPWIMLIVIIPGLYFLSHIQKKRNKHQHIMPCNETKPYKPNFINTWEGTRI